MLKSIIDKGAGPGATSRLCELLLKSLSDGLEPDARAKLNFGCNGVNSLMQQSFIVLYGQATKMNMTDNAVDGPECGQMPLTQAGEAADGQLESRSASSDD